MSTNASNVGGRVLPVLAGATDSPFRDPTIVGIADFLGFMIRDGLNAQLATSQAGLPVDACPPANIFHYDPQDFWVRNQTPALYVWWKGVGKRVPRSLLYDFRVRQLCAMWVFAELVAPEALELRSGIVEAVDSAFFRAGEHGYHPDYAYDPEAGMQTLAGEADGTPLYKTLGITGWRYEGGTPGFVVPVPDDTTPHEGMVKRGFPALVGTFEVYERVTRMGTPSALVQSGPGSDFNNQAGLEIDAAEVDTSHTLNVRQGPIT